MNSDQKYQCPDCGGSHPHAVDVCPSTQRTVPEVFRLEGEVIEGKYEVRRRIGAGGMGVVYEANHLGIGRKLAIKFLQYDFRMDDDIVSRFQNEAKIAAAVGHRNIVEIIDLGKYRNKFHYIIMEYLEGEDLGRTLERTGKFSRTEAVDIIIMVLAGLQAVHSKGIIHRDLKPENVFIGSTPEGERYIKILDFGVSRLVQNDQKKDVRVTKDGMVFGTPTYMSPEQVMGRKDLDQRADLYAAGAILFEMLTGVPPFDGENVSEVLFAIVNDSPPALFELDPSAPDGLSEVLSRALAKSPAERYQSAREFMEALKPYSSNPLQSFPSRQDGAAADARVSAQGSVDPGEGISVERNARTLAAAPFNKGMGHRSIIAFLSVLAAGSIIAGSVLLGLSYHRGNVATGDERADADPVKISIPVDAAPSAVKQEAKASPKESYFWKVSIPDLPEGASVFIDDALHPERPLVVQESSEPHLLRVEIGGYVLYESKIFVRGDLVLPLDLDKKKISGKDHGKEKKKHEVKVQDGQKETVKTKEHIDMSYPE